MCIQAAVTDKPFLCFNFNFYFQVPLMHTPVEKTFLVLVCSSTERCGAGPLQRRRFTLILHRDRLPDAEREAFI